MITYKGFERAVAPYAKSGAYGFRYCGDGMFARYEKDGKTYEIACGYRADAARVYMMNGIWNGQKIASLRNWRELAKWLKTNLEG